MLAASMLLDLLKAPGWYVMVMYLACDTFMENHLTTLECAFSLKLMPENQGHSSRLCLGYICYGRRTIYLSTIFPTIFSAS